jgi:23S rRNA (adenine2503-C2)-methyltransferase
MYKHLWNSVDDFSNIPKGLRNKLNENYNFSSLTPETHIDSSDGFTQKTLFKLENSGAIETVLMRYHNRNTLCISTQVGCAMGCVFCATGQMGYSQNLSRGHIIEQILYYSKQLSNNDERVTNIVMMGMGEPFHNYDETMTALEILTHSEGYNFGARRFTISTVGIIPAIHRFIADEKKFNLAISLHAISDDLRTSLLPINDRYPIEALLSVCKEYINKSRRRITFEWALIQGVNDTKDMAMELAKRLEIFRFGQSILCHVNIIPLNPIDRYSGTSTSMRQAEIFRDILLGQGIPCTIRLKRGIDIHAGCGQLATKTDKA